MKDRAEKYLYKINLCQKGDDPTAIDQVDLKSSNHTIVPIGWYKKMEFIVGSKKYVSL